MAPYIMLGATIAGILHVVISRGFVARQTGNKKWSSVVKASLFGVPLPLCSCGVVPMASYLKKAGASRSSVVSFLISTPQTGIDSMAATYGMMGPFMAVYRPVAAFIAGIASGTLTHLTDRKGKDNRDEDQHVHEPERAKGLKSRITGMLRYAYIESISEIAVNFIIGLAVAAVLSMIIPDDFFAGTVFSRGLPAMLLLIAVGIPMYICSTSSIPVAMTLLIKGFSPGAVFVFLMAGPATNAASLAVLARILGKKQTVMFLLSVIVTSLLGGLVLDGLINLTGYDISKALPSHTHGGETGTSWFLIIVSLIFLTLLAYNIARKITEKIKNSRIKADKDTTVVGITGMTCKNCEAKARIALIRVDGIKDVKIDHKTKQAYIKGHFDQKTAEKILDKAGFGLKIS